MDIMELGAIGEMIGGAAVLVTLVYLAVQVRQGNRTGQRESYRRWVSEMNKVLLEPQRDPEFMELFQRANRDWNSISLRDQGVVNAMYSQFFTLCDEMFSLRESGEISPQIFRQLDAIAGTFLKMPGPAAWWEQISGTFYSAAFCDHISRLLASDDCPPPMHHILPWYLSEEDTR